MKKQKIPLNNCIAEKSGNTKSINHEVAIAKNSDLFEHPETNAKAVSARS